MASRGQRRTRHDHRVVAGGSESQVSAIQHLPIGFKTMCLVSPPQASNNVPRLAFDTSGEWTCRIGQRYFVDVFVDGLSESGNEGRETPDAESQATTWRCSTNNEVF